MSLLILKGEEIKSLLSMDEVINVVEEAFKEKGFGRVQMPPKPYLFFEKYNGDLRVMPSYLEKFDVSAVKIVNSHPENPKQGFPTVMATIILINPKTGVPLAIMDGTWITAMRTGAASGVATKYLARKNSRRLGLVGAGAQAYTQLMAMSRVLKLEEVKVWSLGEENAKAFVERVKGEYSNVDFLAVKTVKEAVENCDVVVTSTPSRKPLVMVDWVGAGTHINAIGADAPGKQELDPKILKKAKIVLDDWEQGCHGGGVNVPLAEGIISREDIYGEIGEVVTGKKAGRTSDDEITVFVSTGLAIQDAVTANLAYKKALKKGLGIQFSLKEFISSP